MVTGAYSASTSEIDIYFVIRMIDSARFYKNEAQVGVGLRRSGVQRENIFISEFISRCTEDPYTTFAASKVFHGDFTYDKTKAAVKDSIKNLGFGNLNAY